MREAGNPVCVGLTFFIVLNRMPVLALPRRMNRRFLRDINVNVLFIGDIFDATESICNGLGNTKLYKKHNCVHEEMHPELQCSNWGLNLGEWASGFEVKLRESSLSICICMDSLRSYILLDVAVVLFKPSPLMVKLVPPFPTSNPSSTHSIILRQLRFACPHRRS